MIGTSSHLPYHDTKPEGASDFYFAIVATFRFVISKFGHSGWVEYLQDLGRDYFAKVNQRWAGEGLGAVAEYWREFFAAEPGSDVRVEQTADSVVVNVLVCPMIAHLRASGREPLACLCQHCFYLNDMRASEAGLAMRLQGGNGSCKHTYTKRDAAAPQEMTAIKEFTKC